MLIAILIIQVLTLVSVMATLYMVWMNQKKKMKTEDLSSVHTYQEIEEVIEKVVETPDEQKVLDQYKVYASIDREAMDNTLKEIMGGKS